MEYRPTITLLSRFSSSIVCKFLLHYSSKSKKTMLLLYYFNIILTLIQLCVIYNDYVDI